MKRRVTELVTVLIAGFLLVEGAVHASERRIDRGRGDKGEGDRPPVLLASGPRLALAADFDAPPPAPAVEDGGPAGPIPFVPAPITSTGPPSFYAGPPLVGAGPPLPGGPPAVLAVPMAMPVAAALYPCVKYKDQRHIAPGAVPLVVPVRDPCGPKHRRTCCDDGKCVLVQICVPPCGCPRITFKRDGEKVRYDYGKYAVNITSRHGVVVVNYDD